MGNLLNTIFYEPLYNALIILYDLLGENLALAIIAIAIIVRVIMIPLTLKQIKMAEKNKEFSSKVKELKKKYKNNKEKQQQEMMKLQSEYLPAQLGGCLPLIFQFVLFIYLYQVINNIISEGISGFRDVAYSFAPHFSSDYVINLNFLGIDLGQSAKGIGFDGFDVLPYILIVLTVGASQYFSTKILSAMNEKRNEKNGKEEKKDKKKKEDKAPEDFSEIMQQSTKQAMLLMPILIMFISLGLPSGVSIYWITQSGFVILQQFVLDKLSARGGFRGKSENIKDKKLDNKNETTSK